MARESLLHAILDDPDDDDVRLVYADWLEEHGDAHDLARAQFIRIQIEKERLPHYAARRYQLQAREQKLLRNHRWVWLAQLPPWAQEKAAPGSETFSFRRGFLERAELKVEQFLAHAADFFAHEPITQLALDVPACDPEALTLLANNPYLTHVRSLRIASHDGAKADRLHVLLGSPYLVQLRSLDLNNTGLAPPAVRVLAQARLPELTHLNLSFNRGIGDEGLHVLAEAPLLDSVTHLDLAVVLAPSRGTDSRNDEAFAALFQSPHLGRLRELRLGDFHLGDEGAAALASSRSLSALRRLNLSCDPISPARFTALVNGPTLAGLQALRLTTDLLGAGGVKALTEASGLSALSELRLRHVVGSRGAGLRPADLELLAGSPTFASLATLDLSGNTQCGSGVRALAESHRMHGVETLVLSWVPLERRDVGALAASANLASLRELYLDHCNVGNTESRALAAATHLERLEFLNLDGNQITVPGAKALAASVSLPATVNLSLLGNQLRSQAVEKLRREYGGRVRC